MIEMSELVESCISIHAPREGSDFLMGKARDDSAISIHAPREGSDPHTPAIRSRQSNFYPRSPRGERLEVTAMANRYV